jgi:pSer/pThr/pTyr-binding forkhead associated (FHA) protein
MFVDGAFMIEDFSSTNGTWVRLSLPYKKSSEVELKNGTIIKLGTTITYICRIHEEKKKVDTFMEDEGNSCPGCLKATKNCLTMPCQHNVYCW